MSVQNRLSYYFQCGIYHVALVGFLALLPPMMQWTPSGYLQQTLKVVASLTMLVVFVGFLVHVDMLLFSYATYVRRRERQRIERTLTRREYYLRAVIFDCFLVAWPIALFWFRDSVPFVVFAYFFSFGTVASVANIEYAFYRYEKYVRLANEGRWGLLGKI